MGNDPPKPQAKPKPVDPMDLKMDIKMIGNNFERNAKKYLKKADSEQKKAKQHLKKNDDFGARCALGNMVLYQNTANQLRAQAHTMNQIETKITIGTINQEMMQEISTLVGPLQNFQQEFNVETMQSNLKDFTNQMDNMSVKVGIAQDMMGKQNTMAPQQESNVEMLMQQIKQEVMTDQIIESNPYNNMQQPIVQPQINQQMQMPMQQQPMQQQQQIIAEGGFNPVPQKNFMPQQNQNQFGQNPQQNQQGMQPQGGLYQPGQQIPSQQFNFQPQSNQPAQNFQPQGQPAQGTGIQPQSNQPAQNFQPQGQPAQEKGIGGIQGNPYAFQPLQGTGGNQNQFGGQNP